MPTGFSRCPCAPMEADFRRGSPSAVSTTTGMAAILGNFCCSRPKFPPVHDGHRHVEEDQVRVRPFAKVLEGLEAVSCDDCDVASGLDDLRLESRQLVVVFNDQNALRQGVPRPHRLAWERVLRPNARAPPVGARVAARP